MVLPAGHGRVHVVWGAGSPARRTLDNVSFTHLFHSLRPRGLTSDGGKALLRDLQGAWRNSERYSISQYAFGADGRYERGLATSTRLVLDKRTSAGVDAGRYGLRDGTLILTSERGGRDTAYASTRSSRMSVTLDPRDVLAQ